jgi:hypothetical protein
MTCENIVRKIRTFFPLWNKALGSRQQVKEINFNLEPVVINVSLGTKLELTKKSFG